MAREICSQVKNYIKFNNFDNFSIIPLEKIIFDRPFFINFYVLTSIAIFSVNPWLSLFPVADLNTDFHAVGQIDERNGEHGIVSDVHITFAFSYTEFKSILVRKTFVKCIENSTLLRFTIIVVISISNVEWFVNAIIALFNDIIFNN